MSTVHVYPVNDRWTHEDTSECYCKPVVTSFLLNGRSAGREIIHRNIEGNYELRKMLACERDWCWSQCGQCEGTRTYNLLRRDGIDTAEQLTKLTAKQLSDIRGIGPERMKRIEQGLAQLGMSLSEWPCYWDYFDEHVHVSVEPIQEVDERGGLLIELNVDLSIPVVNHSVRHARAKAQGTP